MAQHQNYYGYSYMYRSTDAIAWVKGGPLAPQVYGRVYFKDIPEGTMVCADIYGLPAYQPASEMQSQIGPHGFHIHEKGDCTEGTITDPFPATGMHWNPDNQPHGNHAGDFPVLFSNGGHEQMCFTTKRFKPADIIGRSVIIHQSPDDYRTQPSGNSGKKLACGVINPTGH